MGQKSHKSLNIINNKKYLQILDKIVEHYELILSTDYFLNSSITDGL